MKTFGVINNLNKKEFGELCENLSNGVPISTPVFDGAKEQDVTKMIDIAGLQNYGKTQLWDGISG